MAIGGVQSTMPIATMLSSFPRMDMSIQRWPTRVRAGTGAGMVVVGGPVPADGACRAPAVAPAAPDPSTVADRPPLPIDAGGRLDLRAITWVIREAGSGTRRVLEDLAFREGLSLDDLNVFLVLPSNEAVREAIEAGAGATIISRHVVASAITAGTLTAIPIELPPREYALLRHRDRHASQAQQALAAHLTGGKYEVPA